MKTQVTIQDLKLVSSNPNLKVSQYRDDVESINNTLSSYNRIIEKKGSFDGLNDRLQSLRKTVEYLLSNEVDVKKAGDACQFGDRDFNKFLEIVK